MKLRIIRNRRVGGWALMCGEVLVGWSPTFRHACFAADEWLCMGIYMTAGSVR